MSIRRRSSQAATLTGGDLSVDILHTEDSVRLGDGTNFLGTFTDVGGVRSLPVDIKQTVGATDATLTGGTQRTKVTDGTDNVEIDDVGGEKALKVSVIATVGGGSGGTASTDSAAYTPTSSSFTPVGGAFDDTSPDALAEGEMGIVRMTSARAMHVHLASGTVGDASAANQTTMIGHLDGLETLIGTSNTALAAIQTAVETIDNAISGNEMQVDVLTMPTVSVTGTFWQTTQPVSVSSIAAGDNNIGNVDVVTMPTVTVNTHAVTQSGTWNIGSISTLPALAAGTNNIGDVDVLTLPSLPAGTNNIGDVDVLTMPTVTVQGVAAHDAAVSGNPVLIAGRADSGNPTEVAVGDVARLWTDLRGAVVTTLSPRGLVVQATGSQATTTEATMISAGAAGVFHDITQIILTNSNTTTAAQVQIRDATAGTIRFEHMIPANSGMVVNFPVPLCQTTAANNWTIDLNAAVSTVYYTVQAIKRV